MPAPTFGKARAAALLCAAALALGACAGAPAPGGASAPTLGQSVEPSPRAAAPSGAVGEGDPALARLAVNLENPAGLHLGPVQRGGHRIEDTAALARELAALLCSGWQAAPRDVRTVTAEEGYDLTVEAQGHESLVQLFWCGEEGGDFPGQTLLWLQNDGEMFQYTRPGNLVKALKELADVHAGPVNARLTGSYVRIPALSDQDEGMPLRQMLELPAGVALFYGAPYGIDPQARVYLIDPKTGAVAYSQTLPGQMVTSEPCSRPGYDYRVLCDESIFYLNSGNGALQDVYTLPSAVKSGYPGELQGFGPRFDADPEAGLLAFATEDGLYLADIQGQNARLVADAGAAAAALGFGGQARFGWLRLLEGGRYLLGLASDTMAGEAPRGACLYDTAAGRLHTEPLTAPLAGEVRYGGPGAVSAAAPGVFTRLRLPGLAQESCPLPENALVPASFVPGGRMLLKDFSGEAGGVFRLAAEGGSAGRQELLAAGCADFYVADVSARYALCVYSDAVGHGLLLVGL